MIVALIVAGLLVAARPELRTERCFGEGSARVCVAGRLLAFWEQQGGKAVFGLPIAPEAIQQTAAGAISVQYFERARLELHPDRPRPYDVQLGRLGAEWLETNGWTESPAPGVTAKSCETFAVTGYRVCGRLLQYWHTHGLRLDRYLAVSQRESLALFGLPIAAAVARTDGVILRSQVFERARLDERRDGTVMVAPLGQEMLRALEQSAASTTTAQQQAPTPTFVPSATPTAPGPAPTTTATSAPAQGQPTAAPTTVPPPRPAEPIFNVPQPDTPCNRNVPPPANGIQIWVTDPNDNDGADQMTACVRVIFEGEAARGASVHLLRRYQGETRPALAQSTGGDGVASFIFYTGQGSPGRPGALEAVASFRGNPYYVQLRP